MVFAYQLSNLKEETLDLNLKIKINKVLGNNNSSKINIAYANFLLAKYELIEKNYEKEFNYLITGHDYYFESKSDDFENSVEYFLEELPKIVGLWNSYKVIRLTNQSISDVKPIFIVGVPRSGSTLVEKIIGSNSSHIQMGEETEILNSYLKKQNILNGNSLDFVCQRNQSELIKLYKEKSLIQEKSGLTFTDKSLENFFFIGFICELFPQAKIVNCVRNPLSSIMSILQSNLLHLSWCHNLDHIFQYFDIYHEVMGYWTELFPDFIYSLNYEDLIQQPEIETKRLVHFCNLDWDKKCLQFYKNRNLISKTASNMQIRKPLYSSSVHKYEVYRPLLEKYSKKHSWFTT